MVWKDGWRNLHHAETHLEAELVLEKTPDAPGGSCRVTRNWRPGVGLDQATAEAQVRGQPIAPLESLGWAEPLQTHRPFLSYNELGSLLDEGPSKLHDALHRILGLDALTQAQDTLKEARTSREKVFKEAKVQQEFLLHEAEALDAELARQVAAVLATALRPTRPPEADGTPTPRHPEGDTAGHPEGGGVPAPSGHPESGDGTPAPTPDHPEGAGVPAPEGSAGAATPAPEDSLDRIHSILTGATAPGEPQTLLDTLRRIASLSIPDRADLLTLAESLHTAAHSLAAATDLLAERSGDLARMLELAMAYHTRHGDGPCPVCGTEGALNKSWHNEHAARVKQLHDEASDLADARQVADAAREAWAALPFEWHPSFTEAGLPTDAALAALQRWTKGQEITDLETLADHTETVGEELLQALTGLRQAAQAELDRRQDLWRPLADKLAAWLPAAHKARAAQAQLPALRAAEKWLKDKAAGLRDERFQPIADRAAEIWKLLRQQSSVDLGAIRLEGSGPKRKVALDVTIDGVKGAALGVMSQGELHSLALSLFIPRATLPESPFRFIVIDDPVQSMDPARVDGLARVLEKAAADRQVLVFTHDDRLPEAIRRQGIEAGVFEVTRREGSVVELRQSADPVKRHIDDALALALTDDLPAQAAHRVIPGFCRQAIEAACFEAIRRRRLGRGEPHAEVEKLLEEANTTRKVASLALFDQPGQEGDVLARLDKQKKEYADIFRQCNEGAHQLQHTDMRDLVKGTERLAQWLRQLK